MNENGENIDIEQTPTSSDCENEHNDYENSVVDGEAIKLQKLLNMDDSLPSLHIDEAASLLFIRDVKILKFRYLLKKMSKCRQS